VLAGSVAASLLFPKSAAENDPVEHDPLRDPPEPHRAPIPPEEKR